MQTHSIFFQEDVGNNAGSRSSTVANTRKSHYTGKSVRDTYVKNQQSGLYKKLLQTREQLPVYQHKAAILEVLRKHSVVLIAGETGSGKSTQVPHFILEVSGTWVS